MCASAWSPRLRWLSRWWTSSEVCSAPASNRAGAPESQPLEWAYSTARQDRTQWRQMRLVCWRVRVVSRRRKRRTRLMSLLCARALLQCLAPAVSAARASRTPYRLSRRPRHRRACRRNVSRYCSSACSGSCSGASHLPRFLRTRAAQVSGQATDCKKPPLRDGDGIAPRASTGRQGRTGDCHVVRGPICAIGKQCLQTGGERRLACLRRAVRKPESANFFLALARKEQQAARDEPVVFVLARRADAHLRARRPVQGCVSHRARVSVVRVALQRGRPPHAPHRENETFF